MVMAFQTLGFKLQNYQITNCFSPRASPAPNLDRFLHAIADPTRRRILLALKEESGGLCAGDIEQFVKLAQPTVSHHMRILEKAGLVKARREGHWRWYRRNEKLIAEMTRGLKGRI
jgi:ArsR family transcriptional regulator